MLYLWMKPCRAMNFVTELLRRLHDDREVSLQTAASEVYTNSLYQYHGWITSAAFTVALKVCSSAFCSSYAQHDTNVSYTCMLKM